MNTQPQEKLYACWTVELNVECPKCEHEWDEINDTADFWEGRYFEIAESETDRTRNIDFQCPECEHEFKADLIY